MFPHVVVCTSEPHLSRALALHLLRSDFDVWTVSSADAAIERLESVQPKVLLLDLDMPAQQLARLLHALPAVAGGPFVQIVGLTQRPLDDVLDERYARVLTKPFSPRVLRKIVRELVNSQQAIPAAI